ncbi:MAG: GtrA family protein [Chloroflexi bacterium]|nr:GtrA family protein [Chloroflexota bacterium]
MLKLIALVNGNQNEMSRFLKFAAVGAVGAIVDFGVLNLLVLRFGWPKEYANLVSVTCAIFSNFVWNRLWTFPESRERPLHTQFGQFALVNFAGLLINQFVFVTSDSWVYAGAFPHPLDYNVAKATAILVVLFWNFFVNRRWTYRGMPRPIGPRRCQRA